MGVKENKKPKKNKNQKSSIRTFGPLPNLEGHLKSDWWKTLFNSIYLKTDGDIVENHRNTSKDIDLVLKYTNIESHDNVLDLCCGQGRHSIELGKRGFKHVIGIDRSSYLIRVAKKRAAQDGLSIVFSEGDARKLHLANNCLDCVLVMGNSFGYFDKEEEDAIVLKEIKRVLRSKGILFLDIVDGDWLLKNFEPRSWEWIDQNYLVCRERNLSSKGDKIISREVIIHSEKGIIADQLYAERFYNLDKITSLLESVGFIDVKYHANVIPSSYRNQDLGMMGNRLFISAQVPEDNIIDDTTQIKVSVILGDPKLPDKVKKDGKFNQEDFETINNLKKNLKELKKFQFKYINDHKNLLKTLMSQSCDLVLNLCDEGFNNDAFKELHVPGILELLNIPYTGAAPACLGTCYNKSLVRAYAKEMKIPVPEELYFNSSLEEITDFPFFPALLKPNFGDSSLGITSEAVVYNLEELNTYLGKMKKMIENSPILIQEYLTGKEYSVALLGNPGDFAVLPLLEVDYSQIPPGYPPILCYESKWLPESVYWNNLRYKRAELDDERKEKIIQASKDLFERLECRDYGRFDFREDKNGVIKLLEVNPNPGWCWDGKMNIMAGFNGMSYKDFLEFILEAAIKRLQKKA